MKTFNVALLSDDITMKTSYFFKINANNESEAISEAKELLANNLVNIWKMSLDEIKNEIEYDYFPQVFEFTN
jgi:hypothetical protein